MDFDSLPALVVAFVARKSDGAELLDAFSRHVGSVSRTYPDAYFALGQKTEESVSDLTNRVFTTCARVPKGRFPFLGRTPMSAYAAEAFEGRAIRYHSFYAKLSITREILRADYAHNLSSHPLLRWRADLYRRVGEILPGVATRASTGHAARALWTRPNIGPVVVLAEEALLGWLRRLQTSELDALVCGALERGGPVSQARLTHILEPVLGGPPMEVLDDDARPDARTVVALREVIARTWAALSSEHQALLRGLARGLTYDEIVRENPVFAHKVAVNRALARCTEVFRVAIADALGSEASSPSTTPAQLAEAILEVLITIDPTIAGEGES